MMWYRPIVHISVKLVESWVFIFTNTFLPYVQSFKSGQSDLSHRVFNMNLANSLVEYANNLDQCLQPARHSCDDPQTLPISSHRPERLQYPKPCFVCRHGYTTSVQRSTVFQCNFCEKPMYASQLQRGDADGWNTSTRTSDEETCMNASDQCLACVQNLLNAYPGSRICWCQYFNINYAWIVLSHVAYVYSKDIL